MRIEERVYTVCSVRAGTSGLELGAVVRFRLGRDETTGAETKIAETEEVFPGPIQITEAFADPVTERMTVVSSGAVGKVAWVFDGKASGGAGRYVGAAGLSLHSDIPTGYGFDRATGRLYVLIPDHLAGGQSAENVGGKQIAVQGGLALLDTRVTPVPQPVSFPEFSYVGEPSIRIDPPAPGRPRRVFVRRAVGFEPSSSGVGASRGGSSASDHVRRYPDGEPAVLQDEAHHLVLADEVPITRQPSLSDLDRLTTNVKPREGVTAAGFDATGSAYGARTRLVGGLAAVIRPHPNTGGLATNWELIESQTQRGAPLCAYPDRDLFLGFSREARATDLELGARAAGVLSDPGTVADQEQPSARCAPRGAEEDAFEPTGRKPPWPEIDGPISDPLEWERHYGETVCPGGEAEAQADRPAHDAFAEVSCDPATRIVSAQARGVPVNLGDAPDRDEADDQAVRIGWSSSSVRTEPDSVNGGVVVTATATARGISIGPVRIGLVESVARVYSNGRPGAKRAQFGIQVCGISGLGDSDTRGCLVEDLRNQFVKEFKARFGPYGEVRFPAPDKEFYAGSPGGFVAGVTKDRAEQVDAKLLNHDDQSELPGMELIFYRDSSQYGPGRQIIQLAAVRAVATYGLTCQVPYLYVPKAKDCVEQRGGFDAPAPVPPGPAVVSVPAADAPPPAAPAPQPPLPPAEMLPSPGSVAQVVTGWLVRAFGEGLLASMVWLTLGFPFFLAARRGALARPPR